MLKRLLFLNGLAIVAVVYSHAIQWVYVSMFWWPDRYRAVTVPNYDLLGSPSYYTLVSLQKIGVFGVPAFLFITGFFIAYTMRGSTGLTWHAVGVRLTHLVIPYLIWSTVYLAIFYLDGVRYSPLEYARRLLLGETVPAYYYVILLCQLYLLAPLIAPRAQKWGGWMLLGAGGILACVNVLFYIKFYGILSDTSWPAINRLLEMIPDRSVIRFLFFFVFGIYVGSHLPQFKIWLERYKHWILGGVIVMAPLAIIETELMYRIADVDWRAGHFTLTGSFFAIAFILCFLAWELPSSRFTSVMGDLGRVSFGIYLLHSIILEYGARATQKFLPNVLQYPLLFLALLVVIGVGLPVLLMQVVARSPVRSTYRHLFG